MFGQPKTIHIREVALGENRMIIPQSIHELIAKAPLAHLTTLNSKGGPQVTVVWVGIENNEFVMGHLAVHQKVKNIRRDGRVALTMLGDNSTHKACANTWWSTAMRGLPREALCPCCNASAPFTWARRRTFRRLRCGTFRAT
jgi:hypothetical protein